MVESTDKVLNTLMNLKEDFVTFIILAISLIIIIVVIIYFIYLKNLPTSECNYMDTLYGKIDGNIKSIDVTNPDFSGNLYDYYIKTAYNSCSGGNYKNDFVNICNLTNLLKQGVRCLDFELYCVNNTPVVATSTVDSVYIKETFNSVNFSDVMSTIQSYAFSGGDCPNPNDPIIIHLRCMSNNPIMYSELATIFKSYDSIMLGKKYSYENNGLNLGMTPLIDLMKKVTLIIDRSNPTFLGNQDLLEYVNLVSNSFFMRGYDYNQVKENHDIEGLKIYNQKNMTIVFPDNGSNPANPSGILCRAVGCQMVAIRYQLVDSFLEDNNTFFDNVGYAFCLKPEKLRYTEVTVDSPTPQNPDYSYATKNVSTDYYSLNY
jgi:hypothetical protein